MVHFILLFPFLFLLLLLQISRGNSCLYVRKYCASSLKHAFSLRYCIFSLITYLYKLLPSPTETCQKNFCCCIHISAMQILQLNKNDPTKHFQKLSFHLVSVTTVTLQTQAAVQLSPSLPSSLNSCNAVHKGTLHMNLHMARTKTSTRSSLHCAGYM